MTFIVAVAGKGGVGKSTLSALLVKAAAERTRTVVMAIDADPNSNLGDKLGMKVEHTIGELREDLLRKAEELSAGLSKHELVRYQMEMAKVEGSNFDLLTMGRPEGRGCYCYINNILRTFIDEAMDSYEYAVIDNEAGMEHLSRRTTKRMDVLLVVSDNTKLGVETAKRILALAKEMEIEVGRSVLVVNRVQGTVGRSSSGRSMGPVSARWSTCPMTGGWKNWRWPVRRWCSWMRPVSSTGRSGTCRTL